MISARLDKEQNPLDGPEPNNNNGAGTPGSKDAVAASLLAIKAAISYSGVDLLPFKESYT